VTIFIFLSTLLSQVSDPEGGTVKLLVSFFRRFLLILYFKFSHIRVPILKSRGFYLLNCVSGQGVFVLGENVVDHGVDPVEDGVSHGGGRVAHHAESLEMALVGVVHQRDSYVKKIVQVAVQLLVGAQVGRFDHVAKDVDAVLLSQRRCRPVRLKNLFNSVYT